jgi:HK97 gp10 family phage protein
MTLILEGMPDLLRRMDALDKKAHGDLSRRAVNAGTQIILVDARANAPRDTEALAKSLGKVVRTYRHTKTTVGIVGPRRGFAIPGKRGKAKFKSLKKKQKLLSLDKGEKNPVRYAHLAERDHPYLRPAADNNRERATKAMADRLAEGLT